MKQKISVTGESRKGRARVKQYGSDYILEVAQTIHGGTKFLIRSEQEDPQDLRWVRALGDPDFSITVREET